MIFFTRFGCRFGEVKITITVHRDEFLEKQYLPVYRLIKNNKWRWQAVGAVLACGGGLLSPLVGLVLDLLGSWAGSDVEKASFAHWSIVFYFISIPLFILGAHFLDLLDKKLREIQAAKADPVKPAIGNLALPAKIEDWQI